MKVVVILGEPPPEMGQYSALSESIDLAVYGSHEPIANWWIHEDVRTKYEFRVLEPIRLGRQGHLRWLYRGLWSALDIDQPDVVHLVSEPWGSLAIQAASWARRRDFGRLVLHGCDQQWRDGRGPLDIKEWPRGRMARYSLEASSGFAGENTAAIAEARKGGLAAVAPTAVVHTNPRDPSLFMPTESRRQREHDRRRLGLPVDGVGIGLIGRLVPEKGATLLLEAWSKVRQRVPGLNAWVAIAGRGPLESELRRQADDRTTICGALTFPDQIVAFLRSIDIFVHPPWATSTWAEQAPRALIEAMLSGCLIVATDSGANAELINGTGILVPESDPEGLAGGIVKAIELAEGHERPASTRERAVNEYSVEATADKLLDLWRRVVASP